MQGNVQLEEPNHQYEAWFCSNQLVRSWIFGTLSKEVLGTVHTRTTSREVWISLAENFKKSSLAREFSLRRNLSTVNQKGQDFGDLLQRFQSHLRFPDCYW